MHIPETLPPELIRIAVASIIIIAFVFINTMVLGYLERKLAGWFQRRPGPTEVGPHGILQMVVDGVKLLGKQFAKLDIQLEVRDTDYNRFQDKIRKEGTVLRRERVIKVGDSLPGFALPNSYGQEVRSAACSTLLSRRYYSSIPTNMKLSWCSRLS